MTYEVHWSSCVDVLLSDYLQAGMYLLLPFCLLVPLFPEIMFFTFSYFILYFILIPFLHSEKTIKFLWRVLFFHTSLSRNF